MDPNGVVAFVVSLLLGGLAFLIVARILPGFELRGGFGSAVLVAFVYGVIKALLWKLLVILSFPLVLLTLGLFIFVINAFLLWLTDKLVRRLEVRSFGTLILAAVFLSVLDFVFRLIVYQGAFF
jgi:putative membrane protein